MKCDFCSGQAKEKKVTKFHYHKNKVYMIENVLAYVCNRCGEKYYHVKTLKSINNLVENKQEVKRKEQLEVFVFPST